MQNALRLMLVSAAAILAMAFTAGAASAATAVEVLNEEAANAHCNPVCEIVAEGESDLFNHALGVPVSDCEKTIEAEIAEDGTGHVTSLVTADHPTGGGMVCRTQSCNGVGEDPAEAEWPFLIEEDLTGQLELLTRFCLDSKADPNATGSHCDLEADIDEETAGSHHYAIVATNEPCPGDREVSASWEIHTSATNGAHDTIEIVH